MLAEQANRLDNQVFTDDDGVAYNILRLVEWASRNCTLESINLERLRHEFRTGRQRSDEPDGSPEFVARAMIAEDFPIVVQKAKTGRLWVMDGRHRLWKAFHKKQRAIKGYVIPIEQMPVDAMDFDCEG